MRGRGRLLEETKRRVEDILKKDKEFVHSPEYIKQKKGVTEYLMHLSCMKEEQYPSYWKRRESHSERVIKEQLDSQSELYKEVEKMVVDTWEAGKAGHGNDASGLNHTKLVVKQIFLIENRKHFPMYSTTKKQICMEAAVNKFPSLSGVIQGEWEVKTRKLGMSSFVVLFCTHSLGSFTVSASVLKVGYKVWQPLASLDIFQVYKILIWGTCVYHAGRGSLIVVVKRLELVETLCNITC